MLQRPIYAYHEPTRAFALAGGSNAISLWKMEDSARSSGCEEIRKPCTGRRPAVEFRLQNDSLRGLYFQDASTLVGVHSSGSVVAWCVDWDRGQVGVVPLWTLELETRVTAFEVRAWKPGLSWRVAIGGEEGRVFVLDAPTDGSVLPVVSLGHAHHEAVISLAFHGDRIVSGARDRLVQLWVMPIGPQAGEFGAIGLATDRVRGEKSSSQSLTHLETLDGCQGWPLALSFSNDGSKIAAGCMDNGLYCWKLTHSYQGTRSVYLTSFVHTGWVCDIAFSPDDSVLATACWDHSVGVFDAESLVLRHLFQQHRDYAVKVLFVPGTEALLSASYDQTIAVWDWKRFQSVDVLVGHRDWVGNLVLLRDGVVASVTSDHCVCVWSTRDWRLVEILGVGLYGEETAFDTGALDGFLVDAGAFGQVVADELPSFEVAKEQETALQYEAAALTTDKSVAAQMQGLHDGLVVDVMDLILDAFSESDESEPLFLAPVSTPLEVGITSDLLYDSIDDMPPGPPLTAENFQSIYEALADVDVLGVVPASLEKERIVRHSDAPVGNRPMLSELARVGLPEKQAFLDLSDVSSPDKSSDNSGIFGLAEMLRDEPPGYISTTRLVPGRLAGGKIRNQGAAQTQELHEHYHEDLSVPELDLTSHFASKSKNPVAETELHEILNDAVWNMPGMGVMKRQSVGEHAEYQPFLQIQTSYRGGIHVDLSASEDKIITGGADTEICIWHSRGHLENRFCLPAGDGVSGVGFLAEGRVVYGLGLDYRVHLWLLPRTMLGRPGLTQHAAMPGHRGVLTSAATHSGGRLLLTGSEDTTARLWCLRSGDCLKVLDGHTGAVRGVTFGSRGPVTVGDDGCVNFWDMHGALIDQIDLTAPLLGVDSHGGSLAWVAASGASYRMREGDTRPTHLVGHYGQARSVSFRSDGALVTAGEDGRVFVYGTDEQKPKQEILLPDSICEVRLSEGMLMAACEGGTVYLFRRGFK